MPFLAKCKCCKIKWLYEEVAGGYCLAGAVRKIHKLENEIRDAKKKTQKRHK